MDWNSPASGCPFFCRTSFASLPAPSATRASMRKSPTWLDTSAPASSRCERDRARTDRNNRRLRRKCDRRWHQVAIMAPIKRMHERRAVGDLPGHRNSLLLSRANSAANRQAGSLFIESSSSKETAAAGIRRQRGTSPNTAKPGWMRDIPTFTQARASQQQQMPARRYCANRVSETALAKIQIRIETVPHP